jgi:hypothetical protein
MSSKRRRVYQTDLEDSKTVKTDIPNEVKEKIQRFEDEKWSFCTSSIIKTVPPSTPKTRINSTIVGRSWINTPLEFFFAMLPMLLRGYLADNINNRLAPISTKRTTGKSKRYMKRITSLNMIQFYGIILMLDNIFNLQYQKT